MPSLEDAIKQGKPLKKITRLLDGRNLTPDSLLRALILAIHAEREDIVTLLLDRGANINKVDHTYGPVLTEAVGRGSMAMVSLLLERGADINLDGRYGTPLVMAVTGGNVDIVSLLLDRGADINTVGRRYGTALTVAVRVRSVTIVSLLLDRGADINLDGGYRTPLAIAVREGNSDIVSLLLDRGADINLDGSYGTPLVIAVTEGNAAIVSLLLDRGADINFYGRHGTPLAIAVTEGNVDIVSLLLDRGADINLYGRHGTPLAIAVKEGNSAIVSLLLDRGADINLYGRHGTPLAIAVTEGNSAIVSLLLERGADINLGGNYGTPLAIAVTEGNVDIVSLLLDQGADINLGGRCETPLAIAVTEGNVAIVSLLLDRGADINLDGGYGTPLAIAVKEGDAAADIVSLLLDRGANINLDSRYGTVLTVAARGRSMAMISLLLARGADINKVDHRYGTPLTVAARGRSMALVLLLLDRGADINLDGRYGTPLAIAVKAGNSAIVSLLLDRGADINTVDHRYGTALTVAARGRSMDMVSLLLDRGADINLDGGYGTPLAMAAQGENEGIMSLLLDRGADINLGGRCGTPLAIAVGRENVAIVSLLLGRGADINTVDDKYGTALTVAARVSSVAIVSLLLDQGADINMVGGTYQTPLSAAVFAGGKDVASLLLDRGADINLVYGKFGTVLAQAIHEGMKETVLYLLERGADVLRVGGSYSTPLGVYPDALDAGLLKADPTLLAPVRAAVEKQIANQPTNPYANPLISRPPFPMPYTGPDPVFRLPSSQISSLDMRSTQFYAGEDISPQQSNFSCQELHADILGDLLAALVGLDKDTTQAKRQWIQNDARYFIARNFDFGLAYAAARVAWKDFNSVDFDMISLQRVQWHKHAQILDEARSTAIEIDGSQELILSPYSIMPRRLWDLKSNRVVNFQMLHAVQPTIENQPNFWAVTHSWTSDMSPVWTAINEYQWPVPLPKSTSFEHLRSELLTLGAEYVWIDVLCLRQQSGVDFLDRLKEEWKLDVPTIGNIYRAAENIVRYFNGLGVCFSNEGWDNERHWLQRAWTLQEIANENTTINGGIPPYLDCAFLNSRSKGLKEVIKFRSAIRLVIKLAAQVDSKHGCEVYQLAREMARRHATQPLDKLSGLFYLLHMTKLPCYYKGATDETIWRQYFHLLHVDRKAEILLDFPYRGSDEQWFPTWAQLLDWPERDPECDHMRFQISLGLMRDLSGGTSFFIRDIWTISDASIDEISPGEYKVIVNKTHFHFFLPYLSQKPINIEGQPVFTLVTAKLGHSYNWMVCRAIGKRAGIDYNLEEAEVNVLKKVGVLRTDTCGELLVHGLLDKRDWLFI